MTRCMDWAFTRGANEPGAARAAAKLGDAARATIAYANFLRQWQQGDAQLPELQEAQNYLKEVRVR